LIRVCHKLKKIIVFDIAEGRGEKEEGRGKKEEARRKKQEGRRNI
jgi:hypothetical protein